MKILIIGKNSQTGRTFRKIIRESNIKDQFIFVGRQDFDLSNFKETEAFFKVNSFDVIINFAAYTMVDKAELKVELTKKTNHLSVQQITSIAKNQNIKFIQISTDYVFDGKVDKPYVETDVTNPLNIYGKSKLEAELAIKRNMPNNAVIIRTSWLYSEFENNFVSKVLKLAKNRPYLNMIDDQIGSPTYAVDLVNSILHILNYKDFIQKEVPTEIYHFCNGGAVSWYGFTKKILEIAKIKCKINPINTNEYPTPAKRPKNTTMNTKKIEEKFGLCIPHWDTSLALCISSMKENNNLKNLITNELGEN